MSMGETMFSTSQQPQWTLNKPIRGETQVLTWLPAPKQASKLMLV